VYKLLIRPLLFLFEPEKIHHFSFAFLKAVFRLPFAPALLKALYQYRHPALERQLFGLRFPNPIGLAAGFDKNASLVDELASLGFGFIEIGTLTPKAQPGNAQPRLFRLPADGGIINRMGFNNEGVAAAVQRLKAKKSGILIGGNIGKNKDTPNEEALRDYALCFEALFEVVDYFVVNVSSPNTPGLRDLQEKEPLTALLQHLQQLNLEKPKSKPILLKIAPDLSDTQLDEIVEIVEQVGIAGIIATNTTISREGLHTDSKSIEAIGAGGLSGKPLRQKSTEVIRYLHRKSEGKIPIIAVGGIFTAEDALEKLQAGASLVQVYTGFVYEGPAFCKKINRKIAKLSPF
jgi:dihydroorotate dehydrogenase